MLFHFLASHPFPKLERAFQILLEEYDYYEFLIQQLREYHDQFNAQPNESKRLKIKNEINRFIKENKLLPDKVESIENIKPGVSFKAILNVLISGLGLNKDNIKRLFLSILTAKSGRDIFIVYLALSYDIQVNRALKESDFNPSWSYEDPRKNNKKLHRVFDFYYQEALNVIDDYLKQEYGSDVKEIWDRYCSIEFHLDAKEMVDQLVVNDSLLDRMSAEWNFIQEQISTPEAQQELLTPSLIPKALQEGNQFKTYTNNLNEQISKLLTQVDPSNLLSRGKFYYEAAIYLQSIDGHFKKLKSLYEAIRNEWEERHKLCDSLLSTLNDVKAKRAAEEEKLTAIKIEPIEAPSLALEEKNTQLLPSELLKNITIEQDKPEGSQTSVSKISIITIETDSSSQISPIALAPQALSSSSDEEAITSKELPEMEHVTLEETVWVKKPKFLPQSSTSPIKDESKDAAVFIEDPKGIAQEIIDTVFNRKSLLTFSQLQEFVTFLGGKLIPNSSVPTHFRIELKNKFNRLVFQEEEDISMSASHKKDTKKEKSTQHSEKKVSKQKEKETVDSLIFGGAQYHSSSKGSGKHLRAWVVNQFKNALIKLEYDEKYFENIIERMAAMKCKK